MALTVRTAATDEVAAAYRTVLAPSFAPDGIGAADEFRDSVLEGRSTLWVGVDDDLVAAAVTRSLPPSGAVLLSHLATRSDRRGEGIGSRLLRALLTDVEAEEPSLVLAEVQHPDFHLPDPERGDPLGRLRFFSRFGARILEVPYFAGSRAPGRPAVYGLLLLALHVRPDLVDPAHTELDPADRLLAALRTLLREAREPDERATAALLSAASRGTVRMLGVDRYGEIVPGVRHEF